MSTQNSNRIVVTETGTVESLFGGVNASVLFRRWNQ